MIRETLIHIASNYITASSNLLKGHPLAIYLREQAAVSIANVLGDPNLIVKGSPGQTNWADVPWLAVLDPVVTDSATRGYYVVYLFSNDMERVYLVIGQGTTAVTEEFKPRRVAHEELQRRAQLIRSRVPEYVERFKHLEIDLAGTSQLAKDYEAAPALGTVYNIASLPNEETLTSDLLELVALYLTLTDRGGVDTFGDQTSSSSEPGTIDEKRKYRRHKRIERRSVAKVKKIHGYVCQCCGFNFEKIYGELGEKYIEAHHLIPLSSLPEGKTVSMDPKRDFAVLCSNCHRMVHRKIPALPVETVGTLTGVASLKLLLQVGS